MDLVCQCVCVWYVSVRATSLNENVKKNETIRVCECVSKIGHDAGCHLYIFQMSCKRKIACTFSMALMQTHDESHQMNSRCSLICLRIRANHQFRVWMRRYEMNPRVPNECRQTKNFFGKSIGRTGAVTALAAIVADWQR